MQLPIFCTREYKYFFVYENRYSTDREIIPIGGHCQTSFLLRHLGLQCTGYPFDWLMFMEPSLGPKYIIDNIKNNFSLFLTDLKRNEDGYIYAEANETVLFYHYTNLMEDKETLAMLKKRVLRFQKNITEKKCSLVFMLDSYAILTDEKIEIFCEYANKLKLNLKPEDELLIILRYKTSEDRDKEYGKKIVAQLNEIAGVKAIHYFHNTMKNGVWGDFSSYKKMMDELGVRLKIRLPRIGFNKIPRKF